MSLSLPNILMGLRFEAFVACIRMPRKQRRSPAASEESDLILNVHPTAEVLSQKRAAWVFGILDMRHFSASQFRTSPAKSRPFMVSVPSLNRSFILCGHSSCHMIGLILFRPDFRLPPCRFHNYLSNQCSVVSCSPAGGPEWCVFPCVLKSPPIL